MIPSQHSLVLLMPGMLDQAVLVEAIEPERTRADGDVDVNIVLQRRRPEENRIRREVGADCTDQVIEFVLANMFEHFKTAHDVECRSEVDFLLQVEQPEMAFMPSD